MTAPIAPLDMTAESGRAAPFDRCHDASLCGREPCAEFLTIRFAVAAKDVRHFQLRALHRARGLEVLRRRRLLLRDDRMWKQIEWAGGGADFVGCDFQVSCRCGQAAMTEQQLNGTNIGALFQQVNRKSVSKRMRRDGFRNLANTVGLLALTLDCKSCDVLAREISWEEPVLGLFDSPPSTQDLQ